MTIGNSGSFRLLRVSGIDVFLHWSWFLVAVFEINQRSQRYTSFLWNVIEYLALFAIVLLHEFGHVLACRQVGGRADRIVLWPLGGVAFVDPPQRPGATLWSIAAGPLVNVALLPVLFVLVKLTGGMNDVHALLRSVAFINAGLLVFNLMPVYPLDGGQILRSLLWFPFGRARSLMIATVIGFLGVGVLGLAAVVLKEIWFGIVAAFILMNCWQGLQHALALARMAKTPRRAGCACPHCGAAPMAGALWVCSQCQTPFDTFESGGICPHCGARFSVTRCPDCGKSHPIDEWLAPPAP